MTTIIPDTESIRTALNEAMDAMLKSSGGTSGRSFTPVENKAWKALLEARYAMDRVDLHRKIDTTTKAIGAGS